MNVKAALVVSYLCCLQFARHHTEGWHARQATSVNGCSIVLSPLRRKAGVRLFSILPAVQSVGKTKRQDECMVVKSRVFRAVSSVSSAEVTARIVAPDSDEGRKWEVDQPVVAVYVWKWSMASQLKVWMNCSLLGNSDETLWEVLEACTEELLQDHSAMSFQLKRQIRASGNEMSRDRQEELHDSSGGHWKYGVVVPVALLLSVTVILALCAKKRSLDVTSDEQSTAADEEAGAKQAEVDPPKVDVNNEEVKTSEEKQGNAEGVLNDNSMNKTDEQMENGKVDANVEIHSQAANGATDAQGHVDSTQEPVGTTGSGTMTVPRAEMFSGDGYARVRAHSDNADRLVTVGESDSSGDEGPTTGDVTDKTEEKSDSSNKTPELEQHGKHGYSKVVGESPTQVKLKSTAEVCEAPPPARSLRGGQLRFGSTLSNTSAGRAPAVPPGERGSPLILHTFPFKEARNSQDETNIEMKRDSQSDPQSVIDPYSMVDKSSKEDPYSRADTAAKEDDPYASIEEAQSSAGQHPPPLPPTNKFPKSPSLFEIGKKSSRDEPLPPTPLDLSDQSERKSAERQAKLSLSSDRGRSFTASGVIADPKEEPPYAKPFPRSQSQKDSSSGEQIKVTRLTELYAVVDISKKTKNKSAGEQQTVQPVQNVDDLYAKPFKPGKGSPLAGAKENTVTAQLAEDGYSCVTKRSRQEEPNYSEVGPAARAASAKATDGNDYASVGDLVIPKLSDVPDPGYENVGQGSEVMRAPEPPDPGYDSIGDGHAVDHTHEKKDPDYENLQKARHDGDNEVEGEEESNSSDAAHAPTPQDPNYDEIDDNFREQVEQYRQRSNSRDTDEDTGL